MFSFLQQAIRNTYHTGSVWPSSSALARTMTRSLRQANGKRRILEVGPGTGPFTKYILKALRPGDEFHVVEINSRFCQELETRLLGPFRAAHPDCVIELHEEAIEDADLTDEFDFIVCGLPFNNFPPATTRSIFKALIGLLKPNAELVYFEYAGVRRMRGAIIGRDGRAKIKRINAHGKLMSRRFEGSRELVLANLPPAVAVRLRGQTSN